MELPKNVDTITENLEIWMRDFTNDEEDWLPPPEDGKYESKADYFDQLMDWVWQHAPGECKHNAEWWEDFGFSKEQAMDLAS